MFGAISSQKYKEYTQKSNIELAENKRKHKERKSRKNEKSVN